MENSRKEGGKCCEERKEGRKQERARGRESEREGGRGRGRTSEREEGKGRVKGSEREGEGGKEMGDCQPSLFLAELYMVQDKSNDFMDTWDFLETRLGDIKDLNKIYAEV